MGFPFEVVRVQNTKSAINEKMKARNRKSAVRVKNFAAGCLGLEVFVSVYETAGGFAIGCAEAYIDRDNILWADQGETLNVLYWKLRVGGPDMGAN